MKEFIEKLSKPVFWIALAVMVLNQLQPLLEGGQSVNLAIIGQIVFAAFMGLIVPQPAALKASAKAPAAEKL